MSGTDVSPFNFVERRERLKETPLIEGKSKDFFTATVSTGLSTCRTTRSEVCLHWRGKVLPA